MTEIFSDREKTSLTLSDVGNIIVSNRFVIPIIPRFSYGLTSPIKLTLSYDEILSDREKKSLSLSTMATFLSYLLFHDFLID